MRHLPALIVLALVGCASGPDPVTTSAAVTPSQSDSAAARTFVEAAERELEGLSIKANQASWVAANFITDDTEALSAEHTKNLAIAVQRYALDAKRFDGASLAPDVRRKLDLLKLSLAAPPPGDPEKAAELTRLTTSMEADYGKGSYCPVPRPSPVATVAPSTADRGAAQGERPSETGVAADPKIQECLQINALSKIMATSRDAEELKDMWAGWRRVGAPMRERYARFVELANEGARELGFDDVGVMWRAGYDMSPEEFSRELERLWTQVQPLYLSLHAYVRAKLVEQYGDSIVPPDGMIPAHLLGNMWAQEWGNVYPIVAPQGVAGPGYDLTELLEAKQISQLDMVRTAERFFTSMGMPALPETFWERSLIVKPRDREVVCHASAWAIDNVDDVRIKMCTEVTAEDFVTVHHELGHNYYQLAYGDQPLLFKSGANDGFHEAVGDALALSITPEYLKTIGLLEQLPSAAADTALLLRQALDKVAFLPFGLLIDQWRWKVFSGEVTPANYNAAWWELRNRYQGVAAPVARSEADFDPGAKFHVPANTPYTRYFLARVLQFQFYRALCREAGHTGPLHRCSFYGSKAAGDKLWAMLQLGASRPWPDVLYAMTGEREMDASAMAEYFAPLKAWLDRQNEGRTLGW